MCTRKNCTLRSYVCYNRRSTIDADEIQRVADIVSAKTKIKPKLGIICGSGLGQIADELDPVTKEVIPYENIDGFPECTGILSQLIKLCLLIM